MEATESVTDDLAPALHGASPSSSSLFLIVKKKMILSLYQCTCA